jgi:hypothetical protein
VGAVDLNNDGNRRDFAPGTVRNQFTLPNQHSLTRASRATSPSVNRRCK